ncbi:hypothetical protein [Archangium sp.]|uniref:hypothetical protein n=1 Tax=Archangium sp. TaxID=1872627 RepID=UPI002ED806B8
MSGPPPKTCITCGRGIAPSEVYYRFTLVLEGEQDVLDTPRAGSGTDELTALLKQLEASPESSQAMEEQVHWERAGVVCAACRTVVMRTLAPPTEPAGPH